jgi:hypothetical protein
MRLVARRWHDYFQKGGSGVLPWGSWGIAMSDQDARTWLPDSLHGEVSRRKLAKYSYVVLEELIQGSALLLAWPWPEADSVGVPTWPRRTAEPLESVIDVEPLRAQLYRPSRLRRPPRVGDVFAVERLGPGWRHERVDEVSVLVGGNVYDVTVDARAGAKLAYFGAVTGERRPAAVRQRDRRLRAADGGDKRATRLRTRAPVKELTVLTAAQAAESSQ